MPPTEDTARDESQALSRFRTFSAIAYASLATFAVALVAFISPSKALAIYRDLCRELADLKVSPPRSGG